VMRHRNELQGWLGERRARLKFAEGRWVVSMVSPQKGIPLYSRRKLPDAGVVAYWSQGRASLPTYQGALPFVNKWICPASKEHRGHHCCGTTLVI
ncbi:MAG TPA: hypothetical protein DCY79_06040, partial [Planctomycetaceae bacterium]|nr:hypothetical protein [Planctomycetaceae bacterium]